MSVAFELSRDPYFLAQYYELRERCFRKELGIPHFDGSEDDRDRQGAILLALEGDRCLGGVRIATSLDMDGDIGDLDLAPDGCCMWERLVIDPSIRDRTLQLRRDFCRRLIGASRRCGYQHALVLSSLRNARFYRQCHSAMGIDFRIHRQLNNCARGAFASIEHCLSVAHLQDKLHIGGQVSPYSNSQTATLRDLPPPYPAYTITLAT